MNEWTITSVQTCKHTNTCICTNTYTVTVFKTNLLKNFLFLPFCFYLYSSRQPLKVNCEPIRCKWTTTQLPRWFSCTKPRPHVTLSWSWAQRRQPRLSHGVCCRHPWHDWTVTGTSTTRLSRWEAFDVGSRHEPGLERKKKKKVHSSHSPHTLL